jgi:hypothetical protein
MQGMRALPATTVNARWRWRLMAVLAASAFAANVAFLVAWAAFGVARHDYGPFDYPIFAEATTRLTDGRLYDWSTPGYIYPYSPVFAWLMVPFAWLGQWIWQALHLITVAFIPSWPIRLLVLLSAAFWMDAWEGNVGVFFMVAGYWAIRDSRPGSWSFMALCLMIPKPIYLPALVWILWRKPENRRPFLYLFAVHAVAVLATGYAFDWLVALPGSSHDIDGPFNFMPSRFIGWWWWPIGLALSAWLVTKDHPGWAGVTSALYGGHHLPLMLVMEPDYQLRRLARALRPGRQQSAPK